MTTRPTPETDAVVDRTSLCPDNNESCMAAAKLLTSLARQLERDRDALREALKEICYGRTPEDHGRWEALVLIRAATINQCVTRLCGIAARALENAAKEPRG